MKIDDKEVNFKITPKALLKIEELDKDFDILELLRNAEKKEPRMSDYYKLCYAGYIGATEEDITFDEFLEKVKDINIVEINNVGVNLLLKRKN